MAMSATSTLSYPSSSIKLSSSSRIQVQFPWYSAAFVAVPSGVQYQEHLRDFINIVYFDPKVFPNFLPEKRG
jgi:hypothetical protein